MISRTIQWKYFPKDLDFPISLAKSLNCVYGKGKGQISFCKMDNVDLGNDVRPDTLRLFCLFNQLEVYTAIYKQDY